MNIFLNDQIREIQPEQTLDSLSKELELPQSGCAVAVNDRVVPRTSWNETTLQESDKVLVIHAAQGG